ncbi:hypothetical protein EJB05_02059, partial [Eragrostis curvula]
MPGYNKLREVQLKEERAHIDRLLKCTKSTWDQKGVTICADGWTDPQRRPLINFVAISGNSAMFLRADNCEGEVKTKEYIAEKLKSVIDESICDPRAPRNEDDQYVWQQLEFINTIRGDAATIKNFIMNHGMRLSMFKKFSRLKLLSIAETRFASVVCMLKRMVEVKQALKQMVISEEWAIYKDDDQISSFVRDTVLSELWWKNVDFVLKITTPIHDMIRLADTDTPCLHLIYEMWDSMIEKVKKEIYQWEGKQPNEVSDLYSVIYDILIARWTKGNNPLHCLAHSLSPRMRMTCFKKFFRIPQELAQVKEEYAKFSGCSDEFSSHDAINDRSSATPLAWWSSFGQDAPLLMNLAMKLLNQPASSSCCERNWSTYSFIHSVKRNALTPERAEDLVFVHSNLRHLSRRSDAYKKGETSMWDVGGDSFESLSGVGILEVADLSLDEPELEAVSFGDAEVACPLEVIEDE